MRRIFYDTEFIDNGTTIELISIGMVSDEGEEYYGISADLSLDRLGHIEWHRQNTVPSLPIRTRTNGKLEWDEQHRDFSLILPRAELRLDVLNFIIRNSDIESNNVSDNVELWAWYGAYDHVALAQLWGPMMSLPANDIPMNTCDLKQELERKIQLTGNKRLRYDLPKMEGGKVHNALDDARLLKTRYEWLSRI